MSISRREFFKQLFDPRRLRKLVPDPSSELKMLLDISRPLGTPEEAGLELARIPRKNPAGAFPAAIKSDPTEPPKAGK